MIQLQILSGKQAGADISARRFPFLIGRVSDAQLQIDEAGVWDRHIELNYERGAGFSFGIQPGASVLLNGATTSGGPLRNGDLLTLGACQLRFWLAPTRQKTMRAREVLTWSALVLLFAVQLGLIYVLLH